jgi:hypothetical protein
VLLVAALAAAGAAWPCGICKEDKVAAVYDHAVVEAAARRGHRVAYFAIEGPLPVDGEHLRAVREAIGAVAGVDPRSIRVSLENASCSAAFDPARTSVRAMASELDRRLASRGLAVTSLLESAHADSRRRAPRASLPRPAEEIARR